MSVYDDADEAFQRRDMSRVRELLSPLASKGDKEAQRVLGTFLTFEPPTLSEGIRWLRSLADAGDGHAAHNLANSLFMGGPGINPDPEEATRYMQIAYDSGFEASVSSDPLWWKKWKKPGSDKESG